MSLSPRPFGVTVRASDYEAGCHCEVGLESRLKRGSIYNNHLDRGLRDSGDSGNQKEEINCFPFDLGKSFSCACLCLFVCQ